MGRGWLRRIGLVGAVVLLSGCATGYLLDNQVQSFSGLPSLPANPTYRFERLPSQQAAVDQNQVEALADPALFKAGLRRDDANPRYSVQVSARMQRSLSPWADPWGWGSWNGWPGYGYGYGYAGHPHRHRRHGATLGLGFGGPFPRMEQPWFQREVTVLVRELAFNKVVYETRAFNDGPWLDSPTVLGAMFDAALQGFPNAPPGPRRVNVQIGGAR